MLKSQMRFQKIAVYTFLLIGILVFIYALGIMTDPYTTLYNGYDPGLDAGGPGQFEPALLLYEMQGYNDLFVAFAVAFILIGVSMFFVNMLNRRKYYIGNYVVTGIAAVHSLFFSVWAVINIIFYRAKYAAIDLEGLEAAVVYRGKDFFEPSMLWFDLGFGVCVLILAGAAILVVNLFWKIKLMKRENDLLSGNFTGKSVDLHTEGARNESI